MFRWPQGPYLWELTYLAIQGIGFMGVNAALFVAMSASVPKDHGASTITTYYLFQQLGVMAGVTSTAAFTRNVFKGRLVEKLAGEPKANEVSTSTVQQFQLVPISHSIQMIQRILQDNRFAFTHLSDRLQEIVVEAYMEAFHITPSKSLTSITDIQVCL